MMRDCPGRVSCHNMPPDSRRPYSHRKRSSAAAPPRTDGWKKSCYRVVITQNPTLAPAVQKSKYEPKVPEADVSVSSMILQES